MFERPDVPAFHEVEDRVPVFRCWVGYCNEMYFEVEHFSSGFVGSEDPCSGDVVFGSETFVQDSPEPMQDTRDIEVDDFGVFCVLEKSDQAEPELTVEGQQLVQVCEPTTPTSPLVAWH